jgi:hypothetical protein
LSKVSAIKKGLQTQSRLDGEIAYSPR